MYRNNYPANIIGSGYRASKLQNVHGVAPILVNMMDRNCIETIISLKTVPSVKKGKKKEEETVVLPMAAQENGISQRRHAITMYECVYVSTLLFPWSINATCRSSSLCSTCSGIINMNFLLLNIYPLSVLAILSADMRTCRAISSESPETPGSAVYQHAFLLAY